MRSILSLFCSLVAVIAAHGEARGSTANTRIRGRSSASGAQIAHGNTDASPTNTDKQSGGPCATAADCSLNGVCQSSSSTGTSGTTCVCDAWWQGADCSKLNLLPANSYQQGAAYGYSPNVTSWGGNPVLLNGTYNLFVTEIAYGCFLDAWGRDSTVVHAVSDTPAGPYTKVATVLLPEAHNPQTVVLPNGSLAMFHIGAGDNSSYANCSSTESGKLSSSPVVDASESVDVGGGAVFHVSPGPEGPWQSVPLGLGCNNPAPMVHPNGTVFLICNGGGFTLHRSDDIFSGVWEDVLTLPRSPAGMGTWEDPFLYIDQRGNWHVLAHSWNHTDDFDISGHYYSADGVNWTASTTQPFGHTAHLTDGSVLEMRTRERPKLLFDRTGRPTHLFNGINTNSYCASPASSCKTRHGFDWDYTFVQPLAQA